MKKITKKTTFAELINKYPNITEILFEKGMYCVSCHYAVQETLEEGAIVHGLNPSELVKELNEKIKTMERKNGKNSKL